MLLEEKEDCTIQKLLIWLVWREVVSAYFQNIYVRFNVFMAVKIQVKVFYIVTECNVAVRYQCFRDIAASIFNSSPR
jgi:hypothetical protein